MNKTSACIKLLQLLNCKEILNKNELADLLEINPRNIVEYVKELQLAGYDITSVRGIHGGYTLRNKGVLPSTRLTSKEIQVLQSSCSYLEHQQDFLDYAAYASVVGKIVAAHTETTPTMPITVIDRYPLAMNKEELGHRYALLAEALQLKQKCCIDYLSSANQVKQHKIHPYKVFVYNGAWVVLAWNETVNDFGYFKLNRIQEIKLLSASYTILKTYKESDYIDQFGMKQNGDYYHIKLEMYDLYTVIIERIYGKNQQITRVDEHTTILECDMQNKDIITTFVLGFGSKVKVIEPVWLKDSIQKEISLISKRD